MNLKLCDDSTHDYICTYDYVANTLLNFSFLSIHRTEEKASPLSSSQIFPHSINLLKGNASSFYAYGYEKLNY